jgi:20S proteasome subunit alpha 6
MYDTDVTVWSPQGRLLQVEYAQEAVKQGSACLGLCSKTHVVLCALKRSPHELASFQKKLLKIDDHMGVAIAGLNADARSLAKYMRTECLNHRYVYGSVLQAGRLVADVADKHQRCTQQYIRRPYGVGLLVGAVDSTGPHLYETSPSGHYFEYCAMAIGARAQSGKTYLEKHMDTFPDASSEELIKHGIKALAGCVQSDKVLEASNTSIVIIGPDQKYTTIDDAAVQPYLDAIEAEGVSLAAAAAADGEAKDGDGDATMS